MKKKGIKSLCFAAAMLLVGNVFLHPAYAQESIEEKMQKISKELHVNVNRVTDNNGPTEGIYYIVNKASARFLTGTSTVQSDPQQWLFTKDKTTSSDHFYNMRVDGSSRYLSGRYLPAQPWEYLTTMVDEGNGKICFHYRVGSSYTIRFNPEIDLFMLKECNSNPLQKTSSTSWKFYESSEVTDSDEWFIYKVNYAFGDVDRNGYVNSADARMIQQYINQSKTLTEIEKYLADVNRDGSVDWRDVQQINKPSYK